MSERNSWSLKACLSWRYSLLCLQTTTLWYVPINDRSILRDKTIAMTLDFFSGSLLLTVHCGRTILAYTNKHEILFSIFSLFYHLIEVLPMQWRQFYTILLSFLVKNWLDMSFSFKTLLRVEKNSWPLIAVKKINS